MRRPSADSRALPASVRGRRKTTRAPAPVAVKPADLRKIAGPDDLSNPWVSFVAEEVRDTELGMTARKGGQETAKTRFLLVRILDRWLIAEVPVDHVGKQFTGYVGVWSTPLRKQSIEAVKERRGEEAPLLLPYQLDTAYAYRGQCWAMLGIVAFFVASGVFLLVVGLRDLTRQAPPA